MLKVEKLKKLGEEISDDYISKGIPLTDGLTKVAEDYGLNQHQIHRVAEVANINTHLNMLKTASGDDAYIVFDVADPSQISNVEPEKTAAASDIYDYRQAPNRDSITETPDYLFEKVAEYTKEKSATEKYNEAADVRRKLASYENKIIESSISLETRIPPIYNMVKQAVLGGSDINDITYIIKEAAPFGDYLVEELNKDLEKDRICLEVSEEEFTKRAQKEINFNSDLAKKVIKFNNIAAEIVKTAQEIKKLQEDISDDHPLQKVAKAEEVYMGNKTAGALRWVSKNKKKTVAAFSVPFVAGTVHQAGKENPPGKALTKNWNPNRVKRSYN